MNANVNFPARRPEMKKLIFLPVLTWLATACSNAPIQRPGEGHLSAEKVGAGGTASIPAPIQQVLSLPAPKPSPKTETYSVVVNNVKVQELLFALARDAKINVDIHPGIDGTVTLNAIDQTLQQLLARIAKQVDLRWELDGPNLAVMPDSPFLRTYRVDYVNMSRDVSGTVAISTQIASTSAGASTGGGAGASSGGGNNSSTSVTSKATNNFWGSVERNIKDILRETDKILPEGSSETVVERQDEQATTGTGAQPAAGRGAAPTNLAASPNPATLQQNNTTVTRRVTFREAASVISNPEAGVIVVRATARQHEKVQEYLDQVLVSSRRQVMIEATIAEVNLSDDYQQGISWDRVAAGIAKTGLSLSQGIGTVTGTGLLTLTAKKTGSGGSTFSTTLKLLETFGNVKVLSSPKLSVLNNQTAMLKVVDNVVYFTVKADTTTSATGTGQTTVTTTPNSVSVGLVMSVTPQISENDTVLLNVRPTISRLLGEGKKDPNPNIPAGISNFVPEIQTREMESMLRLTDGEVAIMGGLMSDELSNTTNTVPMLSTLPGIGVLFTSRKDVMKKTELVILLKPTIIRDPSVAGDYRDQARFMPNRDFFANNPGPQQQRFDFGSKQQ
jgi:MSHA biogenesis protein MshL